MESKEQDLRLALLIDAENISPKYIKTIFSEASKFGTVVHRRAYGDWSSPSLSSWRQPVMDNAIHTIQQFSYTKGKNSSDSTLIISAMDLLYEGHLDGFCIVSSDSDFTRLASRLRESQMFVLGMGESKTARSFISACDRFVKLDLVYNTTNKKNGEANKKQQQTPKAQKQNQSSNSKQQKQTADKSKVSSATPSAQQQPKNPQVSSQSAQQSQKKTSPLSIIKASASKPGDSSSGRFRLPKREQAENQELVVEEIEVTAEKVSARTDMKEESVTYFASGKNSLLDENFSETPDTVPNASEEMSQSETALETELEGYGSDLDAVRDLVRDLVDERSGDDGWIFSGVIGNLLIKHMPDFDVRNFGYRKLTPFLTSLELFEVKSIPNKDDNSIKAVYIKLKEIEGSSEDQE